jgi:hypothetical protein
MKFMMRWIVDKARDYTRSVKFSPRFVTRTPGRRDSSRILAQHAA